MKTNVINSTVLNTRLHLQSLIGRTVRDKGIVKIKSSYGKAVLLSDEHYNSLMETLYITSNPEYYKTVINAINEPLDECIDESEVEW